MTDNNSQLGFDALLAETDTINTARVFARKTAHLPGTMDEAIAFHQKQIITHHQAMLDCDFETAFAIRNDAHLLARKLNHDKPGFLADDNSPECILVRECAAKSGDIPLWGQDGLFAVTCNGVNIQIEISGMFDIGAKHFPFANFSAKAIDCDKPFISETGYRSFLGCSVEPETGMTTEGFVARILERFIREELKGKPVAIDKSRFFG